MSHLSKQNPLNPPSAFEKATYAKVTRRLMPLLLICYVVSYLDRVNVGFAKLQMLSALGFSDLVYGFGAGIFFVGYFLFEVPSNIIMHRVGARLWIARIMFTWGIVSASAAFVTTPTQFYVLRFLLGIAEAGFFPGIVLYLTHWYPTQQRGRAMALFMTAVPLTGVVGGPLSGWILESMGGVQGLAGWQWLFLAEALPALVAGAAVLYGLDRCIGDADWLKPEEQEFLQRNVDAEEILKPSLSLRQLFRRPDLWLLSVIYFSFVIGLYGISFWLPTIIRATGVTHPLDIGLLTAIPYGVAAAVMIPVSRRSDRQLERRWHVAIPAILGGIGLLFSVLFAHSTLLAMMAMTLATAGIVTTLPLFWSLPTARLGGLAAAAGLAVINSIGNLGGFVSPYLIGLIANTTHDTRLGMVFLAGSMFLGALLTLTLGPFDEPARVLAEAHNRAASPQSGP